MPRSKFYCENRMVPHFYNFFCFELIRDFEILSERFGYYPKWVSTFKFGSKGLQLWKALIFQIYSEGACCQIDWSRSSPSLICPSFFMWGYLNIKIVCIDLWKSFPKSRLYCEICSKK